MKTITLILAFTFISTLQSQYSKESENTQYKKVTAILTKLKKGDISDFACCIESDLLDKTNFKLISEEVIKVKNKTEESIVLVNMKNENIFRCRYYVNEISLYQIDLIFQKDETNGKSIKITTKNAKTLKKEYHERMKNIDIPNEGPPPPPN
jgi:hypothetical protein